MHGATVLDIGGGIGAIELELLAAGAERATNVELSGGYEEEAAELIAERGVLDRVDRRVGDFVEDARRSSRTTSSSCTASCAAIPTSTRSSAQAAGLTRRRLVLTYPQERSWIGAGLKLVNAFLRLRGCGFRTYLHPVAHIVGAAERHGLELERRVRHGLLWESAALVSGTRVAGA